MSFSTIKFEEPEKGIGMITLNRPDRLNALNLGMLDDLYKLFGSLNDNEKIRIIIITGEGRGFCSGADLKARGESERKDVLVPDAATHLVKIQKRYAGIIIGMRNLRQPLIAAVNGHAAGGGMSMAMASDVILGSPKAAFTPSFANIGLSGGELGSSYFLPRLVGATRAAEILLTGRTVYAEEAEKIGLITRLVDEKNLLKDAMETARAMLEKNRFGLWMTKEVLKYNLNAPSLEAAIELENRNQSICCFTDDFAKAIEAFSQRKK